jgi:hypothetical protein
LSIDQSHAGLTHQPSEDTDPSRLRDEHLLDVLFGRGHNLFLFVLNAELRIQARIRNWVLFDVAHTDSPIEETSDDCPMNRQAAAVARSERQTHTEFHYALRGDGGEKNNIILLAPRHELFPHELTFSARETVLATEFQPLAHGSFDRDVLADWFAFQQGFEVGLKPLHIRLRFRPDAGLGRALVLSTAKLIPVQSCFGLSPVELKPE